MTSPSYCAPCIADLALVREAVTTVAGTSSCMAHAVLLTHSSDDPGRRRQRLDALRDLAHGKAETADPAEQAKLELLVQEYGLAGAMDMGGPARRAPQPHRPGGQGGAPSAPGEGRKSRRGRGRGEGERGPREGAREGAREGGARGERRPGGGETAPVTPAPGPAGEGAPVEAVVPAAGGSDQPVEQPQAAAAPEQTSPLAPQPAPEQSPAEREQPSVDAPAAAPAETPAAPQPDASPVPPTSDPDA